MSLIALAVSVRAALAFREWPPGQVCGELDTYRKAPCRRRAGHRFQHSAVGCEAGC